MNRKTLRRTIIMHAPPPQLAMTSTVMILACVVKTTRLMMLISATNMMLSVATAASIPAARAIVLRHHRRFSPPPLLVLTGVHPTNNPKLTLTSATFHPCAMELPSPLLPSAPHAPPTTWNRKQPICCRPTSPLRAAIFDTSRQHLLEINRRPVL